MNAAVAGNDHELESISSPDAAAGKGGMGGFMLNDGGETMEDIASMLFGDTFGNQNVATNLRVEIYPNCDNDDSEFTVISSKTPFVLKLDNMILQERYLLIQISPIFVLGIDSEVADSETMTRAFKHLSRPANEGGPRIFIG